MKNFNQNEQEKQKSNQNIQEEPFELEKSEQQKEGA